MRVEVVYAVVGRVWRERVEVEEGATVATALSRAQAAMAAWPGDAKRIERFAVFGREVTTDSPLRDGDRLELLRPLTRDPKDTRRLRAEQNPLRRRP